MDHDEHSTASQATCQPLVEDWDAKIAYKSVGEISLPGPNQSLPPSQKPKRQMLRASVTSHEVDKPVLATFYDFFEQTRSQARTSSSGRQEEGRQKETKRRKKNAVEKTGGEPAVKKRKTNSKK